MQHEAEGAGRLNPAQALVDLPAQSQDKPSTGVSILGKDEDNPATHTVPLYTPTIPGYTGEDSQELRVRKWQSQTLSFSFEDKYLLPGDPLQGALQGDKAE